MVGTAGLEPARPVGAGFQNQKASIYLPTSRLNFGAFLSKARSLAPIVVLGRSTDGLRTSAFNRKNILSRYLEPVKLIFDGPDNKTKSESTAKPRK